MRVASVAFSVGLALNLVTPAFAQKTKAQLTTVVIEPSQDYLKGSWTDGDDCRMRRTLTGVPSETNSSS